MCHAQHGLKASLPVPQYSMGEQMAAAACTLQQNAS
jgi:hypothetical protein